MDRLNSTDDTLICESSSVGRASPCQGEGREFESRLSLHWCGGVVGNIPDCHSGDCGFDPRAHRQ